MRRSHSFMLVAVGLILALQPDAIAQVQEFPVRPITLIVPWPAGGAQDALGRMLAPKLADRLGRGVIIDNRPGAGSVIGMAAGARAAPDGYTLVQAGAAFASVPPFTKSCPTIRSRISRPLRWLPTCRSCSLSIPPCPRARRPN